MPPISRLNPHLSFFCLFPEISLGLFQKMFNSIGWIYQQSWIYYLSLTSLSRQSLAAQKYSIQSIYNTPYNYKHHKESWQNFIFLLKHLASLVNALKNTDKNNQTYTNFYRKSFKGELIGVIIVESCRSCWNPNRSFGTSTFFRFFKDLVIRKHKFCKYIRTTTTNV